MNNPSSCPAGPSALREISVSTIHSDRCRAARYDARGATATSSSPGQLSRTPSTTTHSQVETIAKSAAISDGSIAKIDDQSADLHDQQRADHHPGSARRPSEKLVRFLNQQWRWCRRLVRRHGKHPVGGGEGVLVEYTRLRAADCGRAVQSCECREPAAADLPRSSAHARSGSSAPMLGRVRSFAAAASRP